VGICKQIIILILNYDIFRLVASFKLIYSPTQVSDVLVLTVRCKVINFVFVFQVMTLFIPEISVGFTSFMVQIIPIYFTWIL
jgi:hypothetical protein